MSRMYRILAIFSDGIFDFDISYEIFLNKIINLIMIVAYDSF